MRSKQRTLNLPSPALQIEFSICLAAARKAYLIDALSDAVAALDIQVLDAQLSEYVPRKYMSRIAAAGLRAELIFPVPLILQANPRLLAYYRLLLGISQKAFYTNSTGAAIFKRMEDAGVIPTGTDINALARELTRRLAELIDGIGMRRVTRDLLDDLTLLTLGPQLLGEAEKSHQKARQKGYVECWTIVNVARFDSAMASRESPSTNRFYSLAEILDGRTCEFMDFRSRLTALTGISDKKGG